MLGAEALPWLVSELARRISYSRLADEMRMPEEEIRQWSGKRVSSPYEAEAWKLLRVCYKYGFFDLPPAHGIPPVSYNPRAPFVLEASPLGYNLELPPLPLKSPGKMIAGYRVDFPLGLPASVLAANAKWIEFYARRGFDILTYKTVRTRYLQEHDWPNWVFLQEPVEIKDPYAPPTMSGYPGYWPENLRTASMANSFGVPSWAPEWWQDDVRKAREVVREGHQVLIVSVVASVARKEEIPADFAEAARLAQEAGADIVEGNFSCPNTPGERETGQLYQYPADARRVCQEMRDALNSLPGKTPLFVKIGYLREPDLRLFIEHTWDLIDGIVAINTISACIEKRADQPTFPGKGRETAGVSGWAIRARAEEVAKHLVILRDEIRAKHRKDLTIISVGGVLTPKDFQDRLATGVDAVESCTGAFLNPNLGLEIRYDQETAGGEPFWPAVTRRRMYQDMGESDPDVKFADENARVAWEVSRAVDRIAASLPPEGQPLNAEPITFAPEHEQRGLHAIFTAGTVIGTAREGILLVPERTRKILDALKIPHKTVSLKEGIR